MDNKISTNRRFSFSLKAKAFCELRNSKNANEKMTNMSNLFFIKYIVPSDFFANINDCEVDSNTESLIEVLKIHPSKRNHSQIYQICRFIAKTDFFEKLRNMKISEASFETLNYNFSLNLELCNLQKDEILFRINDIGDKFYIIIQGSVDILKVASEKKSMSNKEYLIYLNKLKRENEIFLATKTLNENKDKFFVSSLEALNICDIIFFKNFARQNVLLFLTGLEFSLDKVEEMLFVNNLNFADFSIDRSHFEELIQAYLDLNNDKNTFELINYLEKKLIRTPDEDAFYFKNEEFFVLLDKQQEFTIFFYEHFLTLKEGQFFGDLALDKADKKRTATIKSSTSSFLGWISNDVYQQHLIHEKNRIRMIEVMYLQQKFFFRTIKLNYFMKKYFHNFIHIELKRGNLLFTEERDLESLYFIREGEFDIIIEANILELNELRKNLILNLQKTKMKLEVKNNKDNENDDDKTTNNNNDDNNYNKNNNVNNTNQGNNNINFFDSYTKKSSEEEKEKLKLKGLNQNVDQLLKKYSFELNLRLKSGKYIEMLYKKNFYCLTVISGTDLIGLESLLLNMKIFYKAVVHSEKAIIYKIYIQKFKEIVRNENSVESNYVEFGEKRVKNYIDRIDTILKCSDEKLNLNLNPNSNQIKKQKKILASSIPIQKETQQKTLKEEYYTSKNIFFISNTTTTNNNANSNTNIDEKIDNSRNINAYVEKGTKSVSNKKEEKLDLFPPLKQNKLSSSILASISTTAMPSFSVSSTLNFNNFSLYPNSANNKSLEISKLYENKKKLCSKNYDDLPPLSPSMYYVKSNNNSKQKEPTYDNMMYNNMFNSQNSRTNLTQGSRDLQDIVNANDLKINDQRYYYVQSTLENNKDNLSLNSFKNSTKFSFSQINKNTNNDLKKNQEFYESSKSGNCGDLDNKKDLNDEKKEYYLSIVDNKYCEPQEIGSESKNYNILNNFNNFQNQKYFEQVFNYISSESTRNSNQDIKDYNINNIPLNPTFSKRRSSKRLINLRNNILERAKSTKVIRNTEEEENTSPKNYIKKNDKNACFIFNNIDKVKKHEYLSYLSLNVNEFLKKDLLKRQNIDDMDLIENFDVVKSRELRRPSVHLSSIFLINENLKQKINVNSMISISKQTSDNIDNIEIPNSASVNNTENFLLDKNNVYSYSPVNKLEFSGNKNEKPFDNKHFFTEDNNENLNKASNEKPKKDIFTIDNPEKKDNNIDINPSRNFILDSGKDKNNNMKILGANSVIIRTDSTQSDISKSYKKCHDNYNSNSEDKLNKNKFLHSTASNIDSIRPILELNKIMSNDKNTKTKNFDALSPEKSLKDNEDSNINHINPFYAVSKSTSQRPNFLINNSKPAFINMKKFDDKNKNIIIKNNMIIRSKEPISFRETSKKFNNFSGIDRQQILSSVKKINILSPNEKRFNKLKEENKVYHISDNLIKFGRGNILNSKNLQTYEQLKKFSSLKTNINYKGDDNKYINNFNKSTKNYFS